MMWLFLARVDWEETVVVVLVRGLVAAVDWGGSRQHQLAVEVLEGMEETGSIWVKFMS